MVIKVCLNDQIHRISKLPISFEYLISHITFLFKGQLPERWTLQYVDSDGDNIILSDEHGFKCLIEDDLKNSNKSVKVHVVSLQDLSCSKIESQADCSLQYERLNESEEQEKAAVSGIEVQQYNQQNTEKQVHGAIKAPVEKAEPIVEASKPNKTPSASELEDWIQIEEKQVKQNLIEKESDSSDDERLMTKKEREAFREKITKEVAKQQKAEFEKQRELLSQQLAKSEEKNRALMKETLAELLHEQLSLISSRVREIIKDEVLPKLQSQPQPEVIKAQQKPVPNNRVVHQNARCDGCQQYPIVGVRYTCQVCPNFDFCESCETNTEHPHNFIKIKSFYKPSAPRNPSPLFSHYTFEPIPNPPKTQTEQDKGNLDTLFDLVNQSGGKKPNGAICEHWQQFTQTDTFKSFLYSFSLNKSFNKDVNMDKTVQEVRAFYSSLPTRCKQATAKYFQDIPKELREKINTMLAGLPEEMLKAQEKEVEKEEEESKFEASVKDQVSAACVETNKSEAMTKKVTQEVPQNNQKTYSEDVRQKANQLKSIFEGASLDDILDFVSQIPDMEIDQLVESYLLH